MAGPLRDKHVLPGETLRLLDEAITDGDSQSSLSDVDYAQEEVLIQETGDDDLFKGYLITTLVLNYKTFNYRLEGLNH
jgi:hypothetical protein